jgi:protocatechuate 3,4-dioxygenase beta subunit
VLAGRVVEAGTTQPVAGAVVTLGGAHTGTGNSVIFSFSQPAIPGGNRRTLTNAQGHFLFTNVPAGSYSIQAERTGFVPGGYGKARASGPPQTIQLGNDDRLTDLRIALSRFATIVGRVIDEAGEPVIGVTVMANRQLYENGLPQFSTAAAGMTDETDDRGEFRLATLIPGEYILSIRSTQATMPMSVVDAFRQATSAGTAPELTAQLRTSGSPNVGPTTGGFPVGSHFFQPTTFGVQTVTTPPLPADGTMFVYPLQFFPAARTPAEAEVIAVRSGETRSGIEFPLRPAPTTSVSGIVTGPSGPMPNMALGLVIESSSLLSNTFFETATTVTDPRGAFTFLGVPAGQYVLRALKIPIAPPRPVGRGGAIVRNTEIPEGQTLWALLPVSVGRSPITGVTVALQPGFRVSGRLEFEGTATKPTPEQMTQFPARFDALDPRAPMSARAGDHSRIAADATGRLSSYQLPPGKYVINVGTIPGWTFKAATRQGRDVSQLPLDLQADVDDLVITFTDKPSSLEGIVRSAKGAPDDAASVLLFPAGALAPGFEGSMRVFREARANPAGAYRLPALPEGAYYVVAVPAAESGDFPSLAFVRRLASLATRVTIGPAEQKSQALSTVAIR